MIFDKYLLDGEACLHQFQNLGARPNLTSFDLTSQRNLSRGEAIAEQCAQQTAYQDCFAETAETSMRKLPIVAEAAYAGFLDIYSRAKVSAEFLYERDKRVLSGLRSLDLPCFFVIAGGYQEPIETKLLPCIFNFQGLADTVRRDDPEI